MKIRVKRSCIEETLLLVLFGFYVLVAHWIWFGRGIQETIMICLSILVILKSIKLKKISVNILPNTFFAVIEFYFEKTKYVTYATMSGAVLNIILNYICIKLFGYMAAGYTTLVCYMLYTVAHYCFAQKICNEEMNGVRIYNLKTLLTITGAFMISGFLLMMTYNAPVIRYGLLVIAGVLAVLNRNKIIALLKSLIAMKKA